MCLKVRPLLANRRGVTGAIFAITTAILIGAAAIATEAGLWYLGRQQSYSVADAAAIAGAIAQADGSDPTVAASAVAAQNGFGAGQQGAIAGAVSSSVQVSFPPASGYPNTNTALYPNATQVRINVDFPTYLASLFHAADINVGSEAVAIVKQTGYACLLSKHGDLTIGMGAVGTYANVCYFASNATDAHAVTISNSSSIYAKGITAVGNIDRSDCDTGLCVPIDPLWGATDWTQGYEYDRPDAAYQLPTTDPFSAIPASMTYPADGHVRCPPEGAFLAYTDTPKPALDAQGCPLSMANVTISGATPPTTPDPNQASVTSACTTLNAGETCAFRNMNITVASSAMLEPGTYLMLNASLTVPANASVTCSLPTDPTGNECGSQVSAIPGLGVTIIFAGIDSVPAGSGNLNIDPGAAVTLIAAPSVAYTGGSALAGVLFYRDPNTGLPADSATAPSVIIADNLTNAAGPTFLQGVMYFPGANVWFAANVSSVPAGLQPLCDVIVADTLVIGYWDPSNPGVPSTGKSGYYANFAGICSSNIVLPTVQAAALVQ
jgi:hypothetical protein